MFFCKQPVSALGCRGAVQAGGGPVPPLLHSCPGLEPVAMPRPAPSTPWALSPSAWSRCAEAAGAGGGSWQPSSRPVARETPLLSAASEQLPDAEPGAGGALRRGPADNGTSWGRSVLGLARPTLPGGPAGRGRSQRTVGLGRALQRSSGPTPEGRAGRVGCSTAAWRGPCCWPQASLPACPALL